MLLMLWLWQGAFRQATTKTIPYSEFKQLLKKGEIVQCTVGQNEITGVVNPAAATAAKPATNTTARATSPAAASTNAAAMKTSSAAAASQAAGSTNGTATSASQKAGSAKAATYHFRTVPVEDPKLTQELEAAHVKFTGTRPSFFGQMIWAWIIPIALMVLLWRFLSKRMGNIGQNVMGFGASQAKLMPEQDARVTFGDVAGCEEAKAELQEVVSFLKAPSRYQALGATIPKGILLVGPPGTGKTLLARAVAGEAKVPFFLISGSDFVEMFVGVGAARMRDMFAKAKTKAPCIVFIDELDAVGRQRGVHLGPVNDEREQTLNQLLVGMDGFEANVGVIILAASNRPEVLDRALLRPGRFDRQVVVDAPDIDGREAILKIHVRNKPLSSEVNLRVIAQETPGLTGADLANLVNEAALLTARHRGERISQLDLEEAVEKVVAGPERKSRRLNREERKRVAFHEVGHALVAANSEHADPVHKISIIPRGRAALGYTLQLPTDDQHLLSRSELLDRITGLLGGRAAEEIVFKEVSTGAENDLQVATALARQMVAVFGMSDAVGLVHCAQRQNPFLSGAMDGYTQRDCSEQTASVIDREVKRILNEGYGRAKSILQEHRADLDRVAGELLKRETLDSRTFRALIGQAPGDKTVSPAEAPAVNR